MVDPKFEIKEKNVKRVVFFFLATEFKLIMKLFTKNHAHFNTVIIIIV